MKFEFFWTDIFEIPENHGAKNWYIFLQRYQSLNHVFLCTWFFHAHLQCDVIRSLSIWHWVSPNSLLFSTYPIMCAVLQTIRLMNLKCHCDVTILFSFKHFDLRTHAEYEMQLAWKSSNNWFKARYFMNFWINFFFCLKNLFQLILN